MKGFTLIELLAVIIILAVIALIATPIILDVIEDAERSANVSEINLIIRSAEIYYSTNLLTGIQFDGKEELYNLIDSNNDKPKEGSLKITNEGNISLSVYLDGICYNKFYDTQDILIEENILKEQCLNKTVDTLHNLTFEEQPINNCYNNSIKLCLGEGNVVNNGMIETESKVGNKYYLNVPITVDYDKGFTVEYTFKADNLDVNDLNVAYKDIQLLSLNGSDGTELLLFYKSDYTKEFSMYSVTNGFLSGIPYTRDSLTKNANELNEQVITLTIVYNPFDNTISQYVNGVLNRSVIMDKKRSKTEEITLINSRNKTSQAGISGEVYSIRFHDYPLSAGSLLKNYEEDLKKFN